jgi:AcrR family transcriptional regulator
MARSANPLVARPRPARKPAEPDDARLGRADWIRAAIFLLAEDSVDALRVDELAKRLGVTKGSFYWHFETREALLFAVLETWRARMTSEIEAFINHSSGSPAARINRLLRIGIAPRPDTPGGPLELSLRDWARRDARVKQVVEEVDAERIAVLVRLYLQAGLEREAAEDTALAHMAFTIGARMLLSGGDRTALERSWKVGKELLVPGGNANGS